MNGTSGDEGRAAGCGGQWGQGGGEAAGRAVAPRGEAAGIPKACAPLASAAPQSVEAGAGLRGSPRGSETRSGKSRQPQRLSPPSFWDSRQGAPIWVSVPLAVEMVGTDLDERSPPPSTIWGPDRHRPSGSLGHLPYGWRCHCSPQEPVGCPWT